MKKWVWINCCVTFPFAYLIFPLIWTHTRIRDLLSRLLQWFPLHSNCLLPGCHRKPGLFSFGIFGGSLSSAILCWFRLVSSWLKATGLKLCSAQCFLACPCSAVTSLVPGRGGCWCVMLRAVPESCALRAWWQFESHRISHPGHLLAPVFV